MVTWVWSLACIFDLVTFTFVSLFSFAKMQTRNSLVICCLMFDTVCRWIWFFMGEYYWEFPKSSNWQKKIRGNTLDLVGSECRVTLRSSPAWSRNRVLFSSPRPRILTVLTLGRSERSPLYSFASLRARQASNVSRAFIKIQIRF